MYWIAFNFMALAVIIEQWHLRNYQHAANGITRDGCFVMNFALSIMNEWCVIKRMKRLYKMRKEMQCLMKTNREQSMYVHNGITVDSKGSMLFSWICIVTLMLAISTLLEMLFCSGLYSIYCMTALAKFYRNIAVKNIN